MNDTIQVEFRDRKTGETCIEEIPADGLDLIRAEADDVGMDVTLLELAA